MVRVTLRLAPFPRAPEAAPVVTPTRHGTTAVRAAAPRPPPRSSSALDVVPISPLPSLPLTQLCLSALFLLVFFHFGSCCRRLLVVPCFLARASLKPPPCGPACGPHWCAAAYPVFKCPKSSAGGSGGAIARGLLSATALLDCQLPCHPPPLPARSWSTTGGVGHGDPWWCQGRRSPQLCFAREQGAAAPRQVGCCGLVASRPPSPRRPLGCFIFCERRGRVTVSWWTGAGVVLSCCRVPPTHARRAGFGTSADGVAMCVWGPVMVAHVGGSRQKRREGGGERGCTEGGRRAWLARWSSYGAGGAGGRGGSSRAAQQLFACSPQVALLSAPSGVLCLTTMRCFGG